MTPRSKCAVLVPVHRYIEPQCEQGLRELQIRGYHVQITYGHSAIDFGRSCMASQALADVKGFEEIMWIDSDIGFNPDDIERLRNHDLLFCCGLYPVRGSSQFVCYFLPGKTELQFGRNGGLIEVYSAGLGFVHTRRVLYEQIKTTCELPECKQTAGQVVIPWFIPELIRNGSEWAYYTEDLAFCHRVRKCGHKIMADTTVELSHIGPHGFTWKDVAANQAHASASHGHKQNPQS
jgi:hypothetical protein